MSCLSILTWNMIETYQWGKTFYGESGERHTALLMEIKNESLLKRIFWSRFGSYTVVMPMTCKDAFADVLKDRICGRRERADDSPRQEGVVISNYDT